MNTGGDPDHPSPEPRKTDRKSRRSVRHRIVAVLLSILVALALVELAFKALSPTPWYRRVVDEQTRGPFGVFTRIGGRSFHLREVLKQSPRTEEAYRILFLGDSFTFGTGLEDPRVVFVARIEDRLNREKPRPGIADYEVFNGGVPGSLTHKWKILLKHAARRFQPDLVVAVFFLRDGVRGVSTVGQIRKIRREMAAFSADGSFLYRHSHAYRFFRDRAALRRVSREYLGKLQNGYLGSPEETAEWRRARANLLDMRDRTAARGARFVMVIFPALYQLDDDYPLKGVCDEIERFCRENDIEVISLLPTYMHEDGPSLWVSPFNQHPNPRGHALAADAIYEFIQPMIRDSD